MISGFVSTKRYSAFLIAFFGFVSPTHAQDLTSDFGNLFDRCRVSIETSKIFIGDGLQEGNVQKRHVRDWGATSRQTAWMLPGSEFYVVLTEWTARDGTIRHLCDVRLIDEDRVLEKEEQGLLLRQFFVTQIQLIGAGTHKIDKSLSPIPPTINAAFLLSEKNPNGCSVTNTLSFSPDGTYFSAGPGEQAIRTCRAE